MTKRITELKITNKMKQFTTILLILISFSVSAQNDCYKDANIVESGRYTVVFNDSTISTHTKYLKAAFKADSVSMVNNGAIVKINHPTTSVKSKLVCRDVDPVVTDPIITDPVIIDTTYTPTPDNQLAFPSAKGAGAYTTGGRGGKVLHVTTLDWDAPGGLKEAIQTKGKRIIVFDVSGEIDATKESAYVPIISGSDYDNITIAGQSAPQGGITLITSEFMFTDIDNVIIRYIRFRQSSSSNQDAIWITGGKKVIIDHCTFSHGGDESGSLASSSRPMSDMTMQHCFFQDSKTGSILGTDDLEGDFTFINNVFSNVSHRFPNPKGEGQYDIINNIVYNWKYRLVRITGGGTYNVINNYYKTSVKGLNKSGWFGSSDINNHFLQKVQTQSYDTPLIYASGSVIYNQRETPQTDDRDMWSVFAGSHLTENSQVPDQYFTDKPFDLVGYAYEIKTAHKAYEDVLIDVGANKTLNSDGTVHYYQDTKDIDDILMIKEDSYNGSFFDSRSDIPYPKVPENIRPSDYDTNRDGIPDVYAIYRGFTASEDLSQHVWSSGYIGVEEFLNQIDK